MPRLLALPRSPGCALASLQARLRVAGVVPFGVVPFVVGAVLVGAVLVVSPSALAADDAPAVATARADASAAASAATEPSTSTSSSTTTPMGRIASLRVTLASPQRGELERLEGYLRDVLGEPASPAIVADVSRRLDLLGRYTAPMCRLDRAVGGGDDVTLSCAVRRARVVRAVRVETHDVVTVGGAAMGLPLALLESDLKKRVFLRAGEPIDDEDALGRGRIGRQRARIEDFLEREGYYGAQVTIGIVRVDDGPDVDVVVRVRGGSFVRVRRVDVAAFGPISQRELTESYSRMCLTGEGLLDGVFVGNLTSCFNRRRLQATTDKFLTTLRKGGHPEARIRVTPTFVDPLAPPLGGVDDDCTLSRADLHDLTVRKLPVPPRCVDLRVEVLAGPEIVTRFHADDGNGLIVDPPLVAGSVRWLRETFVEPSSRLLQLTLGTPPATATDSTLVEEDLRRRLTFTEAASTDEEEARLGLDNVREYLASRGYAAAQPSLTYRRYDDGNVAVDYDLHPGELTPVDRVRVLGATTFSSKKILDGAELASLPRTFTTPGFVTAADIDADVKRLVTWFGKQGFPEANVAAHATRDGDGNVEVVFVVDEGPRFLVDRVVLAGGDDALTPEVLGAIAHCRGAPGSSPLQPPTQGTACRGTPLRPDEFDPDARRVEAVYAAHGYPPVQSIVELGFDDAGKPLVRVSVVPAAATSAEREEPQSGNVKPLRLGEIFVEGNLDTDRDVLLREMGLDQARPGDRLDPTKIAAGVSRLRRTGLYSRVDLEFLGVQDNDDTAHVRVTVEERPSATVDLSMGFSTQQLFSLRLEGRQKNLLGSMFDASAAADMGLFIGRASSVRTQLRWPRVLGTDLSLSFTPLALSYTDEPAGLVKTVPSTNAGQQVGAAWSLPDPRRRLFSTGTSLALDWRASGVHPLVDDKLTIGAALEARSDWLQVQGEYLAPLSAEAFRKLDGLLDVIDLVEPTPVVSLTPRIAYSNIDNPFDPHTGAGAELFVRTAPFALAPYAVLGAQARGYTSALDDRLTLAGGMKLRWGFAADSGRCLTDDTQRCEWALMQNDLLRPGGDRTVRGVDENGIGVVGIKYDQNLSPVLAQRVVQTGVRPGFFGAVVNLEARFTLIRQLFLGELKPAVFTDIGVSTDDASMPWKSVGDLLIDQRVGISVGAGLRYVLPVGPLSVDVAWSPFRERTAGELPVTVSGALGYIF
jgi:outer membrane protein assembly factor BamA